ncbi:hypothetical protein [Fodinicola feengrottensis]|uniref:hypothetical protein n=1 Tax=Fodinicola feengrottensis TaxID=435914 RepID=UPI002441B127|nr:hypothetical protein [Fodinicola feengrottensis]
MVEETAQAGGKNEVTLASGPATLDGLRAEFQERVPPEVTEFFSAVDEVHLPDLWNGYFIGSPQQIADVHRARRPQFVKHAGKLHDVMIVATTGNGVRYAIPVPEDGPVWVLPRPRSSTAHTRPTTPRRWFFSGHRTTFWLLRGTDRDLRHRRGRRSLRPVPVLLRANWVARWSAA